MESESHSSLSAGQTPSSSMPAPKIEPPAASGSSGPAPGPSNSQLSKRRRGIGVVTPNACTECRKKRAKCDGQKPCGRCKAQKDVECIYEIPVRQSKEHLRHEIEALRRQQRQSDSVFSALVRPDLVEEVLQRLRQGQSVEGISEWLGRSTTFRTAGGALAGFARAGERGGATLPTLSTYGGGAIPGAGAYGGIGMSPVTAQAPGMPQEFDSNSPWNFSSHSQTVSTRSDSHPDLMQWTPSEGPPNSRVGVWLQDQSAAAVTTDGPRYRGVDQVLAPLDSPDMKVPPGTWTIVTADAALVQHLLALYFCWEYPTFASLSKEHFMKDFLNGRSRYCSPILVNALLALGCRFSTQPNTRANSNDPRTAGDHFFQEALALFYGETNHHNLTTIQALGIMSIREASCGRDSESWFYAGQSIRLAFEMGLHRLQPDGDDEDEIAVQAATFWGAFALDHAWSLATGSLPQCSCFPHLPPKPEIIDDIEASLWIPYTDDGTPLQRSCEQPSNVRSVYKCFCELSELVHQSLYILHSPGKPVTSRDLLGIYTQYLNWYDRIPEVLRLGHNFTPAVLFAHMYYHFAILLLFRPLIKLRIIGSGILPRDVCAQAADAIQGLLRSYSQLYTLRRTPSFVPYFVLTSSIMHLAIGAEASRGHSTSPAAASNPSTVKLDDHHTEQDNPLSSSINRNEPEPTSPSSATTAKLSPKVAEALSQGIAHLTEMEPCHHFAHQALNILQYLAKKWNIDVDIPRDPSVPEEIDKSTRPATSSLNFFAPNVDEEDFLCAWNTRSVGGPEGPQKPYDSPTRPARASGGEKTEELIGEMHKKHGGDRDPVPRPPRGRAKGPSVRAAKNLENPLFWPFPMQGRPMLPEGQKLEEAGFAPL
ncbi:nitrogen assimilation transcription factor nirA [Durotheca rogersii]|uniref:nitrogen assimilation transcription factor nirA n=1 Tax=Durotheca rogersii TaxID=419775 RepID=UPI00221EE68E|nr:nitrogen assimilation transcription factor nirA [Durotheca rogersii]KAI5861014.1 nitrogen assimilation transcription factor nirA [Durotheca rogersii]